MPSITEALDPAAHLDPQSYNIYGGVSLSLSKVSVPLDVKATWDRMRDHGSPQERALEKCRTLYVRYLAGNCGMWHVCMAMFAYLAMCVHVRW